MRIQPAIVQQGDILVAARLWRSTDQAIPDDTNTQVTFDTTTYDHGGYVSGSSFVIPVGKAGVHLFGANVRTGNASTVYVDFVVSVIKDPGGIVIARENDGTPTTADRVLTLASEYEFADGDTVTLQTYQTVTVPETISVLSNAAYSPVFWIDRRG